MNRRPVTTFVGAMIAITGLAELCAAAVASSWGPEAGARALWISGAVSVAFGGLLWWSNRRKKDERPADFHRREALAAVDDAALSNAAKADKKDVAIGHLTKLKEAELGYRSFAREAERKLTAESRRMRQTLVDDLRLKVQKHARNEGYGLVIDAVTVIHAVPGEVDDLTKAIAAALGAGE